MKKGRSPTWYGLGLALPWARRGFGLAAVTGGAVFAAHAPDCGTTLPFRSRWGWWQRAG